MIRVKTVYWAYNCIWYLLLPFVFLKLWLRGAKAPAYRERWAERLGIHGLEISKPVIWIHAVSVGESIAAVPLIKALQQQYPSHVFLVTTMTPTGSEQVKKRLGESVQHVYAPYDVPCAIQRFIRPLNIKALIIMETELWPNMIRLCRQRNIYVTIANARMSQRSADGYLRFPRLTGLMLEHIHCIAVQNQMDAQRFVAMGAHQQQLLVMGSVKFDIHIDKQIQKEGDKIRKQLGALRPVWIAASTHPGEDEIMLAVQKDLIAKYPNALLILVPRHPERFDAVEQLVNQSGLLCARRTTSAYKDLSAVYCQVYLADTMGEMMSLFAASDIAVVCGSFIVHGGHNVLEPAALGKPVITGKHNFNFSEIHQNLTQAGGVVAVDNSQGLLRQLMDWINNPHKAKDVGLKARQMVHDNRGAVQRFVHDFMQNVSVD